MYLSYLEPAPFISPLKFPEAALSGVAAIWWLLDDRHLLVPFSELTVRAAVMCWLDGCNILCLLTWQAIFYLSTHRTVNELRSLSVLMEDNFLESLVYSCYLVPWVECWWRRGLCKFVIYHTVQAGTHSQKGWQLGYSLPVPEQSLSIVAPTEHVWIEES